MSIAWGDEEDPTLEPIRNWWDRWLEHQKDAEMLQRVRWDLQIDSLIYECGGIPPEDV